MKYQVKCKLYIFLSMVIVVLIILYLLIHTFIVKSILNFPTFGKNESKNILNKEKNSIDARLAKAINVKSDDIKINKDKIVLKLKDFSITMDSLTRKDKPVLTDQIHKKISLEHDVLDTTPTLLTNQLEVKNTHVKDEQTRIIQQKISKTLAEEKERTTLTQDKLSHNTVSETAQVKPKLNPVELPVLDQHAVLETAQVKPKLNSVELPVLDQHAVLETAQIKQELNPIELPVLDQHAILETVQVKSKLNPVELPILDQNVLLETAQVKQESNLVQLPSLDKIDHKNILPLEATKNKSLDLMIMKAALTPEAILEDIQMSSHQIKNELEQEEFAVCNQNDTEIDQILFASERREALLDSLSINSDIGESPKGIKIHVDDNKYLISTSSVKKIYSMQAEDRNMDLKKVVSTYQQVSELYR